MYVIARRVGESILALDGLMKIKVLSVTGKIVRIGFEAPPEIDILREECSEEQDTGKKNKKE